MTENGTAPSSVILCGTAAASLEVVERILRGSSAWEVRLVSDREGLRAARSQNARAVVVVGGCPDELRAELAPQPERPALLLIEGPAHEELAPLCWWPRLPAPSVLTAMVTQATASPTQPAVRNWRRKGDMIIGQSPAVRELLTTLDRIAPTDAPVLISGESGTGKELVARALHFSGPRADQPFVAINCAAIPESLIESELFGHVRGAFTGAVAPRAGVFEAAHKGTLFLDELGEMPLALQAKLLRVIETGEVVRLGSNEVRHTSFRLVAASNRRLDEEVRNGRFREDLFYRVRVFSVSLPPLRDRPEDVPPLVSHYLVQLATRDRRPTPVITKAALEKLLRHQWPGNVRELVNVLERAMVLAPPAGPVDAIHILLPEDASPMIQDYRAARDRFEAQYYSQLLRTTAGNVSLVAKLSQRTRTQVYESLRRLGLDPTRFRVFGELERS